MDSKKISELRDVLDNSSYVIQKNISSSTVTGHPTSSRLNSSANSLRFICYYRVS